MGETEKRTVQLKSDHYFQTPQEINRICSTVSTKEKVKNQHAAVQPRNEQNAAPHFYIVSCASAFLFAFDQIIVRPGLQPGPGLRHHLAGCHLSSLVPTQKINILKALREVP